MASFTLGGVNYVVPEMPIKAIKKIWPFIEKSNTASDLGVIIDCAQHIVAIGIVSATDRSLPSAKIEAVYDLLDTELKQRDFPALREAMRSILKDSGLIPESEEDSTGEARGDALSTETSTE